MTVNLKAYPVGSKLDGKINKLVCQLMIIPNEMDTNVKIYSFSQSDFVNKH